MCAIRRAMAELRLAANPQPHFPALLDDGRFTPTPSARPRQPFPHVTAYDGLLSATVLEDMTFACVSTTGAVPVYSTHICPLRNTGTMCWPFA